MTATRRDGRLLWSAEVDRESAQKLTFYRRDYVLVEGESLGALGSTRANFVRNANGRVEWYSFGGRLHRRQP